MRIQPAEDTLSGHDIIVIGNSAGGLKALRAVQNLRKEADAYEKEANALDHEVTKVRAGIPGAVFPIPRFWRIQ